MTNPANIEKTISKFQQLALSISMLLSFFSLFLLYNLVFFKKKNINFGMEPARKTWSK